MATETQRVKIEKGKDQMTKSSSDMSCAWRNDDISRCAVALAILMSLLALTSSALAQTVQEVRVQWTSAPAAPSGADPRAPAQSVSQLFSMLSRQTMSGRLPRQREPELSADRVVIIARAADGKILDWQVAPDARLVRAEAPGPGGELSGRVFYRERAEFLFTLPDDPSITRIDFYQPRWTGVNFDLELIGGVSIQ